MLRRLLKGLLHKQRPFYDAFSLFLAFTPSLAICSGYCSSLPGICTLSSGYFNPFLSVCTLACYLLWVLHSAFKHLHPALWVLCSFSWRLHPRLLFALGITLCFLAFVPCALGAFLFLLTFAPSLAICSGYYTLLPGICTLICNLLWVLLFTSWRLHPCPTITGDPNRWSQAYSFVPSPGIPNLHNSFHLTSA